MRQGTTVGGRYRLVRCLVSGSMTEVWLALDLRLSRDVVLKRVLADTAEFSRLQAEGRALAAFNHPNVVTLYDTAQDAEESTFWLVMEYVPGGSLAERPHMTPQDAARTGAQIAGALAALHAKGIVHVDVKPANVILAEDGTVKLADFGAAYRAGGRETITPNGALSYTADYAAPEVIMGRPEPRSDVFSLAATVYALVAGRPPRPGTDEGDAYISSWEAARGAIALTADVGPLDRLLREMLRPDPADRPDAEQARRRLAEIADPTRASTWQRPGARVVAGVSVLALVALAVPFGVSRLNGRAEEKQPSAPVPHATSLPSAAATGAAALIGDPRSADPCAMTDAKALGKYGRTELDIDYGNFDRCDVIVQRPGGGAVDVQVDLDLDAPPEQVAPSRNVGKIGVIENPAESDVCRRTLVLPGVKDTTVRIVTDFEKDGEADLCAMADDAATIAAKAFEHGPLKRRNPPLPTESLAQHDACALLDPQALEVIPGIDATGPDIGFGGWNCKWDSTTSDTWVDLNFDRDQPPSAEEDGTAKRLNGYPVFVRPKGEGDETCLIQAVYRAYTDGGGQTAVEKVRIVVGGSRPMDRLCRMATALAGSATAQLRS
ncbi:serine/threonine-protein kinase [Nonomuraea sp. NPDC046802]|uniref:serine/threonine-protein kinase n=1 Tax=Nonomuraea sp. NPDC046802 TaxID=3154919 RepID=UPI0033C2306F